MILVIIRKDKCQIFTQLGEEGVVLTLEEIAGKVLSGFWILAHTVFAECVLQKLT